MIKIKLLKIWKKKLKNIEETKRENFKNNILNILAETLNKILVNQSKK